MKQIKSKRLLYGILLLVLCLVLAGCGATVKADISAYEDEAITVTGLTDEDFTLTAGELAQLDCVGEKVTTKSSKGEITVEAVGPTLETFLKSYGIKQSEISSVTVIASDGYTKTFEASFFITHEDVILSLANGDEPLAEEEQPVRMVIPGATADQWVKGVVELQFEL
ncbi:MAG: molybdopterin-dependent oxidoreductase [Bacillota bacterium]|nr:molybdopterin-dependent oxidoreductase [Bacillota bacterium]